MKPPKIMIALSVAIVLCIGTTAQAELVNVALQSNGGTATAISEGSFSGTTLWAYNANDGNYGTDWASQFSMPAWVQVEFDQSYEIGRVGVQANYHQQTYSVSLSPDGFSWSTVLSDHLSNNIPASVPTINSAGTSYELFDISPVMAKFMRVDVTTTTAPSSHIFQAIVSEIEAYAIPEPSGLSLLLVAAVGLVTSRRRGRG